MLKKKIEKRTTRSFESKSFKSSFQPSHVNPYQPPNCAVSLKNIISKRNLSTKLKNNIYQAASDKSSVSSTNSIGLSSKTDDTDEMVMKCLNSQKKIYQKRKLAAQNAIPTRTLIRQAYTKHSQVLHEKDQYVYNYDKGMLM